MAWVDVETKSGFIALGTNSFYLMSITDVRNFPVSNQLAQGLHRVFMAALTQFLASLTPAPFVNPEEYDGLEVIIRPHSRYLKSNPVAALSLEVYSLQTSA
jgi:hypothetical protein